MFRQSYVAFVWGGQILTTLAVKADGENLHFHVLVNIAGMGFMLIERLRISSRR